MAGEVRASEKPFTMHDYLDIALRRKWYIIIPFLFSVTASFGIYKYLPKIYKAATLILVQPQRVPESYVKSTISDSIASRLNTIGQEILSRTRLERIIQEFDLYSDLRKKAPMEEVVDTMRKGIDIQVQKGTGQDRDRTQNTFSISYEGEEPKTVMTVTNKLTSMFIEENLKVRESQAEGTSEFLSKELGSMEDRLKQKDQEIRNFKERHMGQLPQQLDANLRILERLQQQIKTNSEAIRASEDRGIIHQGQIEQLKLRDQTLREQSMVPRGPRRELGTPPEDLNSERTPERTSEDPVTPLVTQLNAFKRDLSNLQAKYRDTHPDVIGLKKKVANLEPKVKEAKEALEKQEAAKEVAREAAKEAAKEARLKARRENIVVEDLPPPMADPNTERLLMQYTEQYTGAVLEAKRLRVEEKELKDQINHYQRRIEDTPRREQELVLLMRDYELLKSNYQSLLDKKIQAQMAENLERRQKGEQFMILDPARLPEKPIRPDRNKILLIGAVLGVVLAVAVTWFRESMDQSFRKIADVEAYLDLPVLATLPNLFEEKAR